MGKDKSSSLNDLRGNQFRENLGQDGLDGNGLAIEMFNRIAEIAVNRLGFIEREATAGLGEGLPLLEHAVFVQLHIKGFLQRIDLFLGNETMGETVNYLERSTSNCRFNSIDIVVHVILDLGSSSEKLGDYCIALLISFSR